MSKKIHLLYDGDFLRYAVGFANEEFQALYGGKPVFKSGSMVECNEYCTANGLDHNRVEIKKVAAPVAHCLASVKRALGAAVKQTNASAITIYISGSTNFRTKIAKQKEYKGNRKELVKPLLYDDITQYLLRRFNAIKTEGIEADDAMAIKATELISSDEWEPVICTADKDLYQVPVKVFNVQSGVMTDVSQDPFGELTLKAQGSGSVLKGYGIKFFYSQCLTGDVVDNIPGLSRCGAKNAYKMLAECPDEESCQKVILEAYKKVYGDDMVERTAWDGSKYTGNYLTLLEENCRLLWMLRERPNKDGTHRFMPWW